MPLGERSLAVSTQALATSLSYQQSAARRALDPGNLRPRILLADAVGLGKTLEIGMILAELVRRGRGDRILIVTPRHVLEQMQHEMWTRFALPFVRLDSAGIQRVRQKLPATRNPFTYFKRVIISIEGLDAAIVDVVTAKRGASAVPDLLRGSGWLFVELAGDDRAALVTTARQLAREAHPLDHRVMTDPRQMAALWCIREDGAGLAARTPAGRPAHAGWEEAAVPPQRLGGYLRDFTALLAEHELTGLPYGHFGDGCVHIRIDFPFDAADGRAHFRDFLFSAGRLAASYGGSMSGEHGDGRARGKLSSAAHVLRGGHRPVRTDQGAVRPRRPAQSRGDRATPACGRGHPGGRHPRIPHRSRAPLRARPWRPVDGRAPVHRGGEVPCRHDGDRRRDVPVVPGDPGGEGLHAWARAGSAGRRGRAPRPCRRLAAPEVHEALDLCLACKGCSSDCPTGVDMASYKAEALH